MNYRLAPFIRDIRGYSAQAFRSDLMAGVTVAIFAVPQAMAYAMLAGVAPIHGLYAAVVMSIVAALWGSSPYVNTGPTNTAALLTAAAILPFVQNGGDHMPYIVTLCLLVGIIRMTMGLARMGQLMDFVPESAFLGFTIGAGILIGLGQLHHLFGVDAPEATWMPARVLETMELIPDMNPVALLIGLIVTAVMLLFDKHARRFPVALVAIAISGLVAWYIKDDMPVAFVRDVSAIPSGLPPLSLPIMDIGVIRTMLPVALAISVIGLIEAASIAQTLALRKGERLDVNQEFIGQGLSQIAGSFLSSIPGSGSFGRSLLIETSGGATRFANVIFGFATMGALLIPRLLEWIPVSSLSGLLIYVSIKLIDIPRIRRVFSTSSTDSAIMIITFGFTVFYRIEFGIFVGIIGAALVHLHRTRELQMVEYVTSSAGRIAEIPYSPEYKHEPSDIVALGVSGELYYGVSSALRNELKDITQSQQPKHLVLRLRRANSIDYSCWSVLFDIAEHLEEMGGHLYLCGVKSDFHPIIVAAHMEKVLPANRIFPATASPFEAFDRCLCAITSSNTFADSRCAHWRQRSLPSASGAPTEA